MMLKVQEVAKIMKVSRQTVLSWINKGKLKAIKIDRIYLIEQADLDTLIENSIVKK